MRKYILVLLGFFVVYLSDAYPFREPGDSVSVVLLGTGTPRPDPGASGPATAVVIGKKVLVFDAGAGVEVQLRKANLPIKGVTALFITHLHSDHTIGYPDLIFTSWVMGRKQPMDVYGPVGLKYMTKHLIKAYKEDIDIRINGLEHGSRDGYKVKVHEIDTGIVYQSDGVSVEAIPVLHGNWKKAYAYKVVTPQKTIVISGDTRYCPLLEQKSKNVDILIHEVYPENEREPEKRDGGSTWPQYLLSFHTSEAELGKLASVANPKLLILYHIVRHKTTDEKLIEGIKNAGFTGKVIVGKDLNVF